MKEAANVMVTPRGRKFEAYRALDSLEAYLLVEQHRPHADLFLRNAVGRVEAASPRAAGGGSRAAQRVRQNATRYGATLRIRRARPPPYDPNIGKEWRPDVRTRTGHSGTSIRHMARRGREVVLSVTKQHMLV